MDVNKHQFNRLTLKKNHTINTKDYAIVLSNSFEDLFSFLNLFPKAKKFIIVDENTKEDCYPIVQNFFEAKSTFLIEITSGERNKSLNSLNHIWKQLTQFNCTRQDMIINLGGGIIGDMGGFAASCFKRGVKFVQIPTTLLAMVDASVGGKLGINFEGLKNTIGTFCNPVFVYVNPYFLKTLNQRQIRSGVAEMIKHVLISDFDYWHFFKALDLNNPTIESIQKSIRYKYQIVKDDWKENGKRKLLNFGHTIGHAFESYSLKYDTHPLLHGEAVAIGLFIETKISELHFKMQKQEFEQIYQIIMDNYSYYDIDKIPFKKIKEFMLQDKKNKNDTEYSFSLLKNIGTSVFDVNCDDSLIKDAINYYTKRYKEN